jgi:alpha-L-fucosidase
MVACAGKKSEDNGAERAVPRYLRDYAALYAEDPKAANLQWFRDAKFGLFMHYGVYSLLEQGEWVQLRHDPPIPVADYDTLQVDFAAENFDPDFITDLALEAGMQYITITARHHDSFCLFETKETDFNSIQSPAKRDLIGELAQACERKGIGLFLYYSYGLDWKHPYFYSREASKKGEVDWSAARPDYDTPQPEYKFERDEDFVHYIDFVHAQLKELLTQYPNLAGIWLDPIMGYYSRPDLFPIEETYALIRELQPQALISFKQGANGDEDFVAPERTPRAHVRGGTVAQLAWEKNKDKPKEICNTLQPHAWGYNKADDGVHRNADDVMLMLEEAAAVQANLLLNVGPKPDGSFPEEDVATLKEVGRRLRESSK